MRVRRNDVQGTVWLRLGVVQADTVEVILRVVGCGGDARGVGEVATQTLVGKHLSGRVTVRETEEVVLEGRGDCGACQGDI